MTWILLTLVYGILKGVREIVKKKSLEKSTVMEVLFFYTLFGFLLLLPEAGHVGGVLPEQMFWIAFKSFLIFVAWICSFKAIEKIPISVYGILDLSRVLFATLLGIIVLKEVLGPLQIAGLVLVATGLLMLKIKKGRKPENTATKYVILAFISCVLNAVSGLMDKILTKEITSAQLQFWYMLYLMLFYALYLVITRTKIRWKKVLKNYWIWILSILFIIADRCLFVANSIPESRVSVMTLVKQSGCIVTIIAGRLIFKEKNIGYKLLCAAVIIAGIVIGVMK
ncbi:MAG TPA: DMT family transporter [Lachnospiraceae bacterium]|nr:DMT family transporter [Lachnospiraceae bacterium]